MKKPTPIVHETATAEPTPAEVAALIEKDEPKKVSGAASDVQRTILINQIVLMRAMAVVMKSMAGDVARSHELEERIRHTKEAWVNLWDPTNHDPIR